MQMIEVARAVGVALGRITRQIAPAPPAPHRYTPEAFGATEDQVNMQLTVPERINAAGSKIEDIGGTGVHDSLGG